MTRQETEKKINIVFDYLKENSTNNLSTFKVSDICKKFGYGAKSVCVYLYMLRQRNLVKKITNNEYEILETKEKEIDLAFYAEC